MIAPVQPKPVEIYISAVAFTPDRDPVHIQYQGKGVQTGPFAQGQDFGTSFARLAAYGEITSVTTLGTACKAALAAHLAEHGITAVIVDNSEP